MNEGRWRSAAEAGAEAKNEVQTLATPIKDTAVCFMKDAERHTIENLDI
jgi:histone H3/H4